MSDEKSRLEHLREMVAGAETRMLADSCSDQNFAVLGRLRRDLLAELEELDPSAKKSEGTALSEFEKRLRERESSAKSPRRTKSS